MGRIDFCYLVDHDHVAEKIEAGSAQLLRPRNAEQSQLAHLLDIRPRELRFRIELRRDWRYFTARKLADHVADREMLFREIERIFHQPAPTDSPPRRSSRDRGRREHNYRCADTSR